MGIVCIPGQGGDIGDSDPDSGSSPGKALAHKSPIGA
jgi:hypothetical protein